MGRSTQRFEFCRIEPGRYASKPSRKCHAFALGSFFIFEIFWSFTVPISAALWNKDQSLDTCRIFNEKTVRYSAYGDTIESVCVSKDGIRAGLDAQLEHLPVKEEQVCYVGGAPTRLFPRNANGKSEGASLFGALPEQLTPEMKYVLLRRQATDLLASPAAGCDPRTWTLNVNFYRVKNTLPLYEKLGFDSKRIGLFRRHPFKAVIQLRGLGIKDGGLKTVEFPFERFGGRYTSVLDMKVAAQATHAHLQIPISLQNVRKIEEVLWYVQNHITLKFVNTDFSTLRGRPHSRRSKKPRKERILRSSDSSDGSMLLQMHHSDDIDDASSSLSDLWSQEDRSENRASEPDKDAEQPELPTEVLPELLGVKTFFRVCCKHNSPPQPQNFQAPQIRIVVSKSLDSGKSTGEIKTLQSAKISRRDVSSPPTEVAQVDSP